MKQGSTLFLKIAVILMGIPVLALCIFGLLELGNYAAESRFCIYNISDCNRYVCISDTFLLCSVSSF